MKIIVPSLIIIHAVILLITNWTVCTVIVEQMSTDSMWGWGYITFSILGLAASAHQMFGKKDDKNEIRDMG